MRKAILAAKKVSLATLAFAALTASPSSAQFAVIDVASVKQNTVTAVKAVAQTAKQIEQYRTQLQQYENQLKNTLAPVASVWSEAQSTINGLQNQVNSLNQLTRQTGGVDAYLSQFQNPNYYRSSPCFTSSGCTAEQRAAFGSSQRAKQQLLMASNDGVLRGISNQQTRLQQEARRLESMQNNAQGAEGQMQALGYANQFAANQANQLLALREQLMAQQAAAAALDQARLDELAMRNAASTAARAGTFRKSSRDQYGYSSPK